MPFETQRQPNQQKPSAPARTPLTPAQAPPTLSAGLTPADLLQLQRTIGNRAVSRLVSGVTANTESGAGPEAFARVRLRSAPGPMLQRKWVDSKTYRDYQEWDERLHGGITWYKSTRGDTFFFVVDENSWDAVEKSLPPELFSVVEDNWLGHKSLQQWSELGFPPPTETSEEPTEEALLEDEATLEALKEEEPEPGERPDWIYVHDREFMEWLIAFVRERGVGGLCNAWTIDWMQKKMANADLSTRYTAEQLEVLVEKQQRYFELENLEPGAGLGRFSAEENFELEEVGSGDIRDELGFKEIEAVALETGAGYYLELSTPMAVGENIGHAIALYQDQDAITVMDQNAGQFQTSGLAALREYYVPWVASFNESQEGYTAGMLRYWIIYKMKPKGIE